MTVNSVDSGQLVEMCAIPFASSEAPQGIVSGVLGQSGRWQSWRQTAGQATKPETSRLRQAPTPHPARARPQCSTTRPKSTQ